MQKRIPYDPLVVARRGRVPFSTSKPPFLYESFFLVVCLFMIELNQ